MAAHFATRVPPATARPTLFKLLALLHDIGKPPTRTESDAGRIHFYGHELAGADLARHRLGRLRLSAREIEYVTRGIRHHLRPLHLSRHVPPSRLAIHRFFRDAADVGPDVALLSIADQRGKAFAEDRHEVVAVVARLLDAYFQPRSRIVSPPPLLDGREVIALAGASGPAIGALMARLREMQASGSLRTRDEAEAYLRDWRVRRPKDPPG
jgi:hypothetical protein